jgi:hypothetical protein
MASSSRTINGDHPHIAENIRAPNQAIEYRTSDKKDKARMFWDFPTDITPPVKWT